MKQSAANDTGNSLDCTITDEIPSSQIEASPGKQCIQQGTNCSTDVLPFIICSGKMSAHLKNTKLAS